MLNPQKTLSNILFLKQTSFSSQKPKNIRTNPIQIETFKNIIKILLHLVAFRYLLFKVLLCFTNKFSLTWKTGSIDWDKLYTKYLIIGTFELIK